MLTVPEVATMLEVSEMTVRRLIRNGELPTATKPNPHLKRPKRLEIRLTDVQAFMAAGEQGQA